VYNDWLICLPTVFSIQYKQHFKLLLAVFAIHVPFIYVSETLFEEIHQFLFGSNGENSDILKCNLNFPDIW
jgi:hypothetical protein